MIKVDRTGAARAGRRRRRAGWIESTRALEMDRKDGEFHVAQAFLVLANWIPDDASPLEWRDGSSRELLGALMAPRGRTERWREIR